MYVPFSKPVLLAVIGLNHAKLLETVFLVIFIFIFCRISPFSSFFQLNSAYLPLNRPISVEISIFGFIDLNGENDSLEEEAHLTPT